MIAPMAYPSPDGTYEVRIREWEARNSLWVRSPELWSAVENRLLYKLKDVHWSAEVVTWSSNAVVRLECRKYPGNHRPAMLRVVVDCAAGTATLENGAVCNLDQLEQALDDSLTWV